ncbi:hypothetical protein NTGM5_360002 [Candidatus Nitrotoga sp. M5]|nr:hypothetical protein NTGM5_360002 [Candidatus Nitrotoga sp. M5]
MRAARPAFSKKLHKSALFNTGLCYSLLENCYVYARHILRGAMLLCRGQKNSLLIILIIFDSRGAR